MRRFRKMRGEGLLGCVFGLLLLVVVGYVSWKFVQVKLRISEFHDTLVEQAEFASIKRDNKIVDDVLDKADALDIPVTKENLKVHRTNTTFTLETHYQLPVILPGYTYIWKVDEVVERPTFNT
jgi:hypothetical protein